jgi:exopolyphosphatase/guanosine-5'-triphosphate,3'-diphosphate pyrophosphatase
VLRGAVDIGSNSVLLLIARPTPGGDFEVLHEECRITRLGRGVDAAGKLDPDAIARTLEGLRAIAGQLDRHGVSVRGAVGTSALRDAADAARFLEPAEALLGCTIEVIDGHREAELVLVGVRTAPRELPVRAVIFDVGGGSTELIASHAGELAGQRSLDLGAVRLTERFLRHDPPLAEELERGRRHVAEQLAALEPPLNRAEGLIGIAGTVTTLCAVEQQLEVYDRERIDGARLTRAQIEAQVERYASLTLAQREQIPGLEAGRADIITGGALVVLGILERYGIDAIEVSDRGVRWGLLHEMER